MTIFENELDLKIYDNILTAGRGHSKHCLKSAIQHLEKSLLIKEIDREMSVFRAITAEEEAATAIFLILKEKQYENAKKIKFKNHSYKQALSPFLDRVGEFLFKTTKVDNFPFGEKFHLKLEGSEKEKKLMLAFEIGGKYAYPIPPLNFSISVNGMPYYFKEELNSLASQNNVNEVRKYIADLANRRNEILYANSQGVPEITGSIDSYLKSRINTCIKFIRLYALISPYDEKALFVQHVLNSFLIMMGAIESSDDIEPQA